MNRNILRAPLIKSATLLVIVSLLVYFTATSSEGSIWSSLGTLFTATLRIVQLGLGLIVALFFCMVVLTGIFLLCVAMVSRESAAKMVEQIRHEISEKLLLVRSLLIRDVPSKGAPALGDYGSGLKKEMAAMMEDSLEPIRHGNSAAAERMESVIKRLDRIEQYEEITSLAFRLEKQDEHVQGLVTKADQIQDQLANFQKKLNELGSHSHEQQVDPVQAEFGRRMDSLEKTLVALQQDLAHLKKKASEFITVHEKQDDKVGEELIEPRLFAHIKNKALQAKIEQLVTETLDKDMSYAQVIDHLVAHAKGKGADIIAAHPSLVKDYIRDRRKNG